MKINFELLPNEIFIECFQYLNAPDIFYSFDKLNNRFNKLIRNILLDLDFQQFKRFSFNQFCQIILSNSDIKNKIISLKLSNIDTNGQIEEFLSLFPLNEFVNLRSLSLIDLNEKNIEQLTPILPLLSDLYHFSFTNDRDSKTPIILSEISKSKLRILSIPEFPYDIFIFKKLSITSLTISSCRLNELFELFQYASMLKYLKIKYLCHFHGHAPSNIPIDKAIYLKELLIDYSEVNFKMIELLLKRIPNLTIFTICNTDAFGMINANRWQHLIESSLLHLRIFNFNFRFDFTYFSDGLLNICQQFQTNFWYKQHHWYTNYEIGDKSASIYTIPYVWNAHLLSSTIDRYDYSNQFDNVTNLDLLRIEIKDNSSYYFKNVKSLTLVHEYDNYNLQIKSLNKIVNLSNIKHLGIKNVSKMMLSSSLLELLKELNNVSSLAIDKRSLIPFIKNNELCEHLNRKIKTLYIIDKIEYLDFFANYYIESYEVDMICKIFSNIEQLYCYINKLENLLSLLRQCSKLSMINLTFIRKSIYSWYKINASKLNLYIDYKEIQRWSE